MKTTTVMLLATALALGACYASHGHGNEDAAADDAAPDGVDTTDQDGPDAESDPIDDRPDIPLDTCCDEPDVPPANYALHEWGVMVMDGEGATTYGPSPEFAGAIPAKPVIYLYGDSEISPLSIAVDFASGQTTEAWPQVPLGPRAAWDNLALSPGACAPTPFPTPYDDPWMDGTCETCALSTCVVDDAACLTFADAAGVATVSKLLFYTGRLPGYSGPLHADVSLINDVIDRLSVSISNDSTRAVEDAWFVYRQTESTCIDPSACPVIAADIAWMHMDEVLPGSGMGTTVDVQRFEAELDEYGYPIGELPLPEAWLNLGKDLTAGLIDRGLTAAEAGAFMSNWNTLFFGLMGSDTYYVEPLYSNGAFLIYFMPPEDYDGQLPLSATPPPSQIVRVGMIYQPIPMLDF